MIAKFMHIFGQFATKELLPFGFIRGLQSIENKNTKLKYLHFIKEI